MSWEPWDPDEERRLARYANPEAAAWIERRLRDNPIDLHADPDGRFKIARLIYEALAQSEIHYALEPISFGARQRIRRPAEILRPPHQGTCLDLAVLFGALCLHYDLLPMIVLTSGPAGGHAFVAVSRTQSRRDLVEGAHAQEHLFTRGILPAEEADQLRALIDRKQYFAVECTGFAFTEAEGELPERRNRFGGLMTFLVAVATGRAQLDLEDRPLRLAVELHLVHQEDGDLLFPVGSPNGQPDAQPQPQPPPEPNHGSATVIAELERELQSLVEEYQEISKQRISAIDPVGRKRLERKLKDTEEEMQRVEARLDALRAAGKRPAPTRPVTPPDPPRNATAPDRQRCADLAKNIAVAQGLIRDYERKLLLTDDPREKLRFEGDIDTLKVQLRRLTDERGSLGCPE